MFKTQNVITMANVACVQKYTRAQLLLRWLQSVAFVKFSLSSRQYFNALFVSNLWQCHHRSYIAEN